MSQDSSQLASDQPWTLAAFLTRAGIGDIPAWHRVSTYRTNRIWAAISKALAIKEVA
jgi:hypothetical protein